MGMLVDGKWDMDDRARISTDGRFKRGQSGFRRGLASGEITAEAGRYHLYVSLACPWAHRTLIVRRLKGLERAIDISVTHWLMTENGWNFEPGPGVVPDGLHHSAYLHQLYSLAAPDYSGRATVPILWDRQTDSIVNNESSEILRLFNGAFNEIADRPGLDLYPEALRPEIDAVNARIYDTLNNGVYKSGFARTQEAYEEAVQPLFETLDWLEHRLNATRWLVGNRLTEADIRLFPTLIRFDPVYHYHFKCNLRRLTDYPALSAYTRDLYQLRGISATVDFTHIKRHYFESHPWVNPSRVVPIGPILNPTEPHGREALGALPKGLA